MGLYRKFRRKIIIFIMSMMPVSELRGAIPLGKNLGLDADKVIGLSLFGNMLIVPILLKILGPLMAYLSRTRLFKGTMDWIRRRTLKRTKDKIRKYSVLGLFLFVALPIPTTGAWTGCFAASILRLDFKKSLIAIWSGILVSALIVSILTYRVIG